VGEPLLRRGVRLEAQPLMRSLATAWLVPYHTLRKRLVGKVTGYGHASGRPSVLSKHEGDH